MPIDGKNLKQARVNLAIKPSEPKIFFTLTQATKKNLSIVGTYSADCFPQLSTLFLEDKNNNIELDLSFDFEEKSPCLAGTLMVDIWATCQRCLQEMNFKKSITIHLLFIAKHRKSNLTQESEQEIEIINTDQDELNIVDIISDEILLNMPMSLKHLNPCQSHASLVDDSKTQNEAKDTYQPFSNLKQLTQ